MLLELTRPWPPHGAGHTRRTVQVLVSLFVEEPRALSTHERDRCLAVVAEQVLLTDPDEIGLGELGLDFARRDRIGDGGWTYGHGLVGFTPEPRAAQTAGGERGLGALVNRGAA